MAPTEEDTGDKGLEKERLRACPEPGSPLLPPLPLLEAALAAAFAEATSASNALEPVGGELSTVGDSGGSWPTESGLDE